MKRKNKMGFLGKYIANNVNLADPAARTKWKSLINQMKKYSEEALTDRNDHQSLKAMLNICMSENHPDKLMAFGRNLQEYVNTEDKTKLRENNYLLKTVELYSQTTILSNDKRAVKLANDIMEMVIEIRNGS